MGKIVSKARRLRFELQAKRGRKVTLQEVADTMSMNRVTLNSIELNKPTAIDYPILAKLCEYYTRELGRPINTCDVIPYVPDAEHQAPRARRRLVAG